MPLLFQVPGAGSCSAGRQDKVRQRDRLCLHGPELERRRDRQEQRDGSPARKRQGIIHLPAQLGEAPETRATQRDQSHAEGRGLCQPAAPLVTSVQHHQDSDHTFSYQYVSYITRQTCQGRAWLRPSPKLPSPQQHGSWRLWSQLRRTPLRGGHWKAVVNQRQRELATDGVPARDVGGCSLLCPFPGCRGEVGSLGACSRPCFKTAYKAHGKAAQRGQGADWI